VKLTVFSYRYASEILEHRNNIAAWREIEAILASAPIFVYPGKSRNERLDVVQQLMNTYFDRKFAVDNEWMYHPPATQIRGSKLTADFRKQFENVGIQIEVQLGNMARWYSDIFKFQAAYSQKQIHLGLCVVPTSALAGRIDSNVVNFERVVRELPAADLSITLPILIVGIEPDDRTPVVDVRDCRFGDLREITGRGNALNRWRIVEGFLTGKAMKEVGPDSPTGPTITPPEGDDSDDE